MVAAGFGALLKQRDRWTGGVSGHRFDERVAAAVAAGVCGGAGASGDADPQHRLDAGRRSVGAAGLAARSAGGGDAGDGHLRRAADFYLQRRLHGARRELHALLLLPVSVCRSDAGGGDREQPVAAVHVLGDRRADVVSADWVLVPAAGSGGGGEEGIHHDANRRSRPADRNGLALLAGGDADLLRHTGKAAWSRAREPQWRGTLQPREWRSLPRSAC